jgi:hypothetical protein
MTNASPATIQGSISILGHYGVTCGPSLACRVASRATFGHPGCGRPVLRLPSDLHTSEKSWSLTQAMKPESAQARPTARRRWRCGSEFAWPLED